jgi:hypothetical protein
LNAVWLSSVCVALLVNWVYCMWHGVPTIWQELNSYDKTE